MYKCGLYHVIQKTAISAGIYSFTMLCPEIAEIASPGQFVHIRVGGFTLRRPISICDIDKKKGTIRIVFEVRGDGTRKLTETRVGDSIDMIAPLGNGFTLQKGNGKIILVGGGIGVPPLYAVAKHYNSLGANVISILGFRRYDKIILSEEFKHIQGSGASIITCTEDGSIGVKGFVTGPLNEQLDKSDVQAVYACGPLPMLKSVIESCKSAKVFCEVSLEERMGCGVGACACCTCKILKETGEQMLRVCKEGPVFNAEEVVV